MKALVIGGTGPTGPFVVDGLSRRGYEVTILHRGVHEIEYSVPVEHLHGDPHFEETLEQALGSRTFDLVITMYGRLRHAARIFKGRTLRFIAAAGLPYRCLVEGLHTPMGAPVPIPETAPLCLDESLNKFTYLMAISEQVVMEAHRQGSYSATIIRYPAVYGPRQLAPREWSLIRRFLDGRERLIIPNEGLTLETKGYAENMAHTVLLAVDKPQESAGQIYNAGDDRILSLREWAVLLGKVLGRDWELVSLPGELARASRPYAGRDHHRVVDTTKVRTQLGYHDVVPVEEALRRTVQYYLQHPPERGGELEKQLGDAFDYATEDKLIEHYGRVVNDLRKLADVGYLYRHPYAHPDRPG